MRIPLLLLPAVLFPGEILGLRVFEPRYLDMVGHCLAERADFGVVRIRLGKEVGEVAEPEEVGTIARIVESEELDDGSIHLVVVGVERFRLADPERQGDLITAGPERFPEELGDPRQLPAAMEEARQAFETHAALLVRLGLVRGDSRLPDLPLSFSYRIGAALRLDPRERQDLLQAETALERIRKATDYLLRESRFLAPLAEANGAPPN